VSTDDLDPVRMWHTMSDWYAEFAAKQNWGFLLPMVELTKWVADQPFAAQLFPGPSHEWLCVHLRPGYNPDLPFFSCVAQEDKKFKCELWAEVGQSLDSRVVPLAEAHEVFEKFVGLLLGVSERAIQTTQGTDKGQGQFTG